MITNELNLSMATPTIEQAYAKKGDSGRVLKINLIDAEPEDGTLRIRRPDGVEVTSDAESGVSESGDVVTFEAYEEVPLEKLEVDLEPVQDLHGYANPWVGGGGKNLCFLTDPELTVNTPQTLAGPNVLPSGTYTLTVSFDLVNATYSSGSGAVFNLYANGSNNYRTPSQCYRISDNKSMNQLTPPYTDRFWFRFTDIVNPSSLTTYFMSDSYAKWTGTMKNVQLEIGTTPTDFAPYSNICPIYPSNGKNLMPITASTTTLNDVTFTVNDDGTVSTSGTASADTNFVINQTTALVNGTSYKIGGCPSGSNGANYYIRSTRGIVASNSAVGYGTEATATSDALYMFIHVSSGVNANGLLFKPMVVEASVSDTTYVPYQGINVEHTGKNLVTSVENALLSGTADGGAVYQLNASCRSLIFECKEGQTYTVSGVTNNRFVYGFYDSMPSVNEKTTSFVSGSGSLPKTFTALKDGVCVVYLSNVAVDTSTAQAELGSTATSYEPYNGTTHSISLGRSVYGGKVDLVTGKLTITKECVQITSDSGNRWTKSSSYPGGFYISWTYLNEQFGSHFGSMSTGYPIKCSHAKTVSSVSEYAFGTCFAETGNFNIRIMDSTVDLATWRQFLVDQANSGNPIEVWANVGTPIEVDLTPTQISTLLGTNNIWSSGVVDVVFSYGSLFATLPSQATEVVGKCIGDVNFTNISTLPFILTVKENQA